MKYISILVLGMLIASCTNSAYQGSLISILNDRTEVDFLVQPDPKLILPLFHLKEDSWQEVQFRYGELTDLEHNSRHEVFLEGETALLGNEFQRRSKVKTFQQNVAHILEQDHDSLGYQHSTIWEPLINELSILQQDTLRKTTLYIFSDLRENASWFSTYRYADTQLLKSNVQKVEILFLEKAQSITPSSHINVVVVYQPQTRSEDQFFKQLSHLYSQVFEKLGVSISFVVNLKNTHYE